MPSCRRHRVRLRHPLPPVLPRRLGASPGPGRRRCSRGAAHRLEGGLEGGGVARRVLEAAVVLRLHDVAPEVLPPPRRIQSQSCIASKQSTSRRRARGQPGPATSRGRNAGLKHKPKTQGRRRAKPISPRISFDGRGCLTKPWAGPICGLAPSHRAGIGHEREEMCPGRSVRMGMHGFAWRRMVTQVYTALPTRTR